MHFFLMFHQATGFVLQRGDKKSGILLKSRSKGRKSKHIVHMDRFQPTDNIVKGQKNGFTHAQNDKSPNNSTPRATSEVNIAFNDCSALYT
ncbi:hypothetical protein SAMN05443144_108161 [Fodinibius roseus]|uniref:Uncharacterized protein n=1 Tax=Fodinibius roseus TaxID=1194090 RepID=A0A1M5BLA6_9BACT|nr:hypothetical protein SAMN05443144_108161 [Fodinibius roseus]